MVDPITIYTSPTCPYCKALKQFLDENGTAYINKEVTTDREAMAEMQQVSGGARSVPVIVIAGQVLVGWDRQQVEQALKRLEQSTTI